MEEEKQFPVIQYNSSERMMMVLLTIITHVLMLPGLFLIKYQKRIFVYYIYIFTIICSFLYHLCESLNVIIYISYIKWNELDKIGTISLLNSLLISITKFHFDEIEQKMMNYFAFFLLLVFQKRNPFVLINSALPISIVFFIVLYKLIKYGIPKYNKENLRKGGFFLFIGMIMFFLSVSHQNDYLRIYHFLLHIMAGFSMFYLWQIQTHYTIALKNIYEYSINKKNFSI